MEDRPHWRPWPTRQMRGCAPNTGEELGCCPGRDAQPSRAVVMEDTSSHWRPQPRRPTLVSVPETRELGRPGERAWDVRPAGAVVMEDRPIAAHSPHVRRGCAPDVIEEEECPVRVELDRGRAVVMENLPLVPTAQTSNAESPQTLRRLSVVPIETLDQFVPL